MEIGFYRGYIWEMVGVIEGFSQGPVEIIKGGKGA